jgi:Lanthionine synthetase C-like protein
MLVHGRGQRLHRRSVRQPAHTIGRMLFTPERHEPIGAHPYSDAEARAAIATIAARAERELDRATGLWPRDPSDIETVGEGRAASLYWGAAGIAWALDELAAEGHIAGGVVDDEALDAYAARLAADPDDPDFGFPGVWFGLGGVLGVAEHRRPDVVRRDRIAELADASLDSPALEPMKGHPGYMLLAAQLHAATDEERWRTIWSRGAERLVANWERDARYGWLWTQELQERRARIVGAAHGLAGNVRVLHSGGPLLAPDLRGEIDRRAVETLTRLAVVEDGHANWPPEAGRPLVANDRIRVQWCHGAAGVITSMWEAAPDDDAWTDVLLAAGRLVWDAGPIRNQPGLCHGTAGNAYALLALWRRTNDGEWLVRARAFAQHAAAQVEDRATRLGCGRHSLFSGDEGVALALASCIAGDARFPVVDRLI